MSLFANLKAMKAAVQTRFARDEDGSAAFEAIWVGLYLAFMIPPTMFIMEFSQTHMDGNWGQRTAARYNSINAQDIIGSATGIGGCSLPSVPIDLIQGTNAQSLIGCLTTAIDEPASNRFWKKLEGASSDFPTLIDDLKNEGEIKMSYSIRYTIHDRLIEMGDGSGGKDITNGTGFTGTINDVVDTVNGVGSTIDAVINPPQAMAPSTDFYKGTKDHWKKGHDAKFWDDFSNKSRRLFPKVFPSR